MNNVMLDLETMGNKSNAAILSIGACFFDPYTGTIGATFEKVINLDTSAPFGHIDASTVMWWMKQSDEARAVFNCDDAVSLFDALTEFSDWLCQIKDFRSRSVWGNDPTFDNTILGNAYRASGMSQPWPYSGNRCVRTVVELGRQLLNFNPKYDIPFEGVKHSAMDDAIHQAKYVSAIIQRLTLPSGKAA